MEYPGTYVDEPGASFKTWFGPPAPRLADRVLALERVCSPALANRVATLERECAQASGLAARVLALERGLESAPRDVYTKSQADARIAAAIAEASGASPDVFGLLEELAAWAGDDRTGAAALAETVASHSSLIAGFPDLLASKVDKVPGKGLSANDYTAEEKAKLAGVEASAKDNVVEAADASAFPAAGAAGKIYVAKDANRAYRWDGARYVEVGGGPSGSALDALAPAMSFDATYAGGDMVVSGGELLAFRSPDVFVPTTVQAVLAAYYQRVDHKALAVNDRSTHETYPSSKAVYDAIAAAVLAIEVPTVMVDASLSVPGAAADAAATGNAWDVLSRNKLDAAWPADPGNEIAAKAAWADVAFGLASERKWNPLQGRYDAVGYRSASDILKALDAAVRYDDHDRQLVSGIHVGVVRVEDSLQLSTGAIFRADDVGAVYLPAPRAVTMLVDDSDSDAGYKPIDQVFVSRKALAGQAFDLSSPDGLYEGVLNCLETLGAAISPAPPGYAKDADGVWRRSDPSGSSD